MLSLFDNFSISFSYLSPLVGVYSWWFTFPAGINALTALDRRRAPPRLTRVAH